MIFIYVPYPFFDYQMVCHFFSPLEAPNSPRPLAELVAELLAPPWRCILSVCSCSNVYRTERHPGEHVDVKMMKYDIVCNSEISYDMM